MRAEIISVTFRSRKCYYCEDPWKYILDVATTHAETGELTGNTVEICACQKCRDTRVTKIPKERIKVVRIRLPEMEFATG